MDCNKFKVKFQTSKQEFMVFILVDMGCLNHVLWRFISDERELSSLTDEILQSCLYRSVSKELMENDVISLIIEKAQLSWLKAHPTLLIMIHLCNIYLFLQKSYHSLRSNLKSSISEWSWQIKKWVRNGIITRWSCHAQSQHSVTFATRLHLVYCYNAQIVN